MVGRTLQPASLFRFLSKSLIPQLAIRWRILLALVITSAALFSASPAVQASTPIEVGYKDFKYPGNLGGNGEATSEKPESKLWWNDGYWWATMWMDGHSAYHIFKLNVATQTWQDTGTPVDDRITSKPDTLWDGQYLYIVSHIWDGSGEPTTPANGGKLFRYSYNSATDTYSLDNGFPVNVNSARSETLVIAKASNGKLWVTWVADKKVWVNRSVNGDDLQWGEPFVLPVPDTNVSDDDISSVIAYSQHIGIMWSNQNSGQDMYFAVHQTGTPDTNWSHVRAYDFSGDDHINLKSLEADDAGNVYAAIKTSKSAELIVLLVCKNNVNRCRNTSDWTPYTVYNSSQHAPTRPLLLIDISNRQLYIFTRNKDNSGNSAIYYKMTSMDNIQFSPGTIGTPFIKSATDTGLNDPTSTKQNLTSTMGLVVLASDKGPDYYFHNYLTLSGQPQYTLNINVNGSGQVTADPPGGMYDAGMSVTLTANPDPGYMFSGWSGDLTGTNNPATITMGGNKTVTATFVEAPPTHHTLTVLTQGSGVVTLEPEPEPGGLYEIGTIVTLTATPAQGWRFDAWSGGVTGNTNPVQITMDANKTVTAAFSEISSYTLTVNTDGPGTVTVDPPGGSYPPGTQVSLTAVPAQDWAFAGWSGSATGTSNPVTITMDSD